MAMITRTIKSQTSSMTGNWTDNSTYNPGVVVMTTRRQNLGKTAALPFQQNMIIKTHFPLCSSAQLIEIDPGPVQYLAVL